MTKALLLAAGRGKRLRPFTDTTPKPLLPVGSHRLCDWQLAALKRAGITEIVMNTAHLADAFNELPQELAGKGFDVVISREGDTEDDALESLGGIVKALPLLTDGEEPFLVLAGDVVHNYPIEKLLEKREAILAHEIDAHLVAVPNPAFHQKGDMAVDGSGHVIPGSGPHTYGCLMLVSPRIFAGLPVVKSKLFPFLWNQKISAEVFSGFWGNIGDPQEYAGLIANEKVHVYAQI